MRALSVLAIVMAGLVSAFAATATEPEAPAAAPSPNWCPGGDCEVRRKLVQPLGRAGVHIVYLRSDHCGSCRALEAKFENSDVNPLNVWADDPRIDLLVVDLNAEEAEFENTAYALVDRGIASIYNGYLGITGFLAVAATGSEQPVACLSYQYDPETMVSIVDRIANDVAMGKIPTVGQDPFCPDFVNRR